LPSGPAQMPGFGRLKHLANQVILSDINISSELAAIPALLMIAAANQHLVKQGLRFNSSLIAETGQAASPHDIATLLGFGASAICPVSVHKGHDYRRWTIASYH